MLLRNFAAILACITASSSVYVDAATDDDNNTWRPDLDWVTFASQLSPTASLLDTNFSDHVDQCLPEFEKDIPDRTNHALIDQPSGMCVTNLFCAYEGCWPRPDAASSTQAQRAADLTNWSSVNSFDALTPETQGWLEDSHNPSLNLPSKVLFPVVASDVVHAIQFAREHGLEISVKNSGHSYIGASTKKDTLHLNMNRFTQYSPTSLVDCDANAGNGNGTDLTLSTELGEQPCRLAVARNNPAYVRVGGGENWDKVYRAVEAVNMEQGNKYHVVGGASGTVSPMGWTFQGGLPGTTGGRMYGFGVDQVLQVEMVLPNGEHVKFGPVEWEDASAEGFIVPKTTLVAGVCRSNPEEVDESLWEWIECSPDRMGSNFDDLWFAINGGGGGTWGVVTSLYLQLHEYRTPRLFALRDGAECDPMIVEALFPVFELFRLTYVTIPSVLNVPQAESDGCGMCQVDGQGTLSALFCYGDVPYQTLVKEWEKYATTYFDSVTSGISLDEALACPDRKEISWLEYLKFKEGPYAGLADDLSAVGVTMPTNPVQSINLLVPQKYIEENFDSDWSLISATKFYFAFGSGTAYASDQANSLGLAHRTAGYKRVVLAADFFPSMFADMFDIASDDTNFPSIQGSNHVGPTCMGPLKDDWTQVCPEEWTQEERDENCVSIQETIYGTQTLARLEAIKEALDPDYMFDCAGCIGNNRKKETNTETTQEELTSGEETTDTKEDDTTAGETNDTKEDTTSVETTDTKEDTTSEETETTDTKEDTTSEETDTKKDTTSVETTDTKEDTTSEETDTKEETTSVESAAGVIVSVKVTVLVVVLSVGALFVW